MPVAPGTRAVHATGPIAIVLALLALASCAAPAAAPRPAPAAAPPAPYTDTDTDTVMIRLVDDARRALAQIVARHVAPPSRAALVAACRGDATPSSAGSSAGAGTPDFAWLEARVRGMPVVRASSEVQACVARMLESLDDSSRFIDSSEFSELARASPDVAGIGARFEAFADGVVVTRVHPGGPADAIGLARGDRLVAIDGAAVDGRTVREVRTMLRGPTTSDVQVRWMREGKTGGAELHESVVVRDRISLPALYARLPADAIAYFAFDSFTGSLADALAREARGLRTDAGRPFAGIILDLRWSPGGLLEAGVSLASAFLPPGALVARAVGRSEDVASAYRAEPADDPALALPPGFRRLPMVVLIGPQTGGGAEMVAAALQDHHRATVAGARSAGRLGIDMIVPLPRTMSAARIQVATVLRPGGTPIEGVGVVPDWKLDLARSRADRLPEALPLPADIGSPDDPAIASAIGMLREPGRQAVRAAVR